MHIFKIWKLFGVDRTGKKTLIRIEILLGIDSWRCMETIMWSHQTFRISHTNEIDNIASFSESYSDDGMDKYTLYKKDKM